MAHDMENALDLNELLVPHPAATFFIRVTGNSMASAGIYPHDILVIDRAVTPTDNALVIVRIHDQFTINRIKFEPNGIALISENPHHPSRMLNSNDDCEIWGIVTFVIHALNP